MSGISEPHVWRTLAPHLSEDEAWGDAAEVSIASPPRPRRRSRRRPRPQNWWDDLSADDVSDEDIAAITERLLPLASSLLPPRDENPPESS